MRVLLLCFGVVPLFGDVTEELNAILDRYNAWKREHPCVKFQLSTNTENFKNTTTFYYVNNDEKVRVSFLKPNKFEVIQFVSVENEVLLYFPLSNITIREIDPMRIFLMKRMGWDDVLTADTIQDLGGRLQYIKKGGVDILQIYFEKEILTVRGENNSKKNKTLLVELHLNLEGRVERQEVRLGDGSLEITSEIEYLTFDKMEIEEELNTIKVKNQIDEGVDFSTAMEKEIIKTIIKELSIR